VADGVAFLPKLPADKAVQQRAEEIERAALHAAELARAAQAANTRIAYDKDWRRFDRWCRHYGYEPLPANPKLIGVYISACLSGEGLADLERVNIRTVERYLAAIVDKHRQSQHFIDRSHPAIAYVLKGAKRTYRQPKRQAIPTLREDIVKLVETCRAGTLADVRDRAIILAGYYGARRRSEICGIDVEHLRDTRRGLRWLIPHAKNDQEGEGVAILLPRQKPISNCPVHAIEEWKRVAEIEEGPLFRKVNRWGVVEFERLTPQSINLILKQRAKQAGFSKGQIRELSAHSLRAGHVTQAFLNGKRERQIQRQTSHKQLQSLVPYFREGELMQETSADGLMRPVDGKGEAT
jgi:integrase